MKHRSISVNFLILISLILNVAFAQQIATTKDGKPVVLFEDGTWQYLKKNNSSKPVQTKETQIFITRTGKKYHLDGCRYLKSKIPSTLSEAVSKGLGPCGGCRPPTASQSYNTIDLNTQYKSSPSISEGRCQATTQKGTQCKRSAQSNRNYCWQHP